MHKWKLWSMVMCSCAHLPMLDGEVSKELKEHEAAVDVLVVCAIARPRPTVHDEQF